MSSRSSEIDIMGTKRMNKKISVRNRPIVPSNIAQSHRVGMNIPQLDGAKSRCKLVITMTNRSTHIPTFTDAATKNKCIGRVRTSLDQSACGTRTFRNIRHQNIQPYGPKARLYIMYLSNTSPLYHAVKASMMYP